MTETISDEDLLRRFSGYGVDRESAPHFRARLEHRLLVNRCGACGTWHHPPKPICPECWSTSIVPTEVAGTATVDLTIFLYQGPPAEGVDYSTPYPVVTVELDEQPGLRLTSTIVGAENDEIVIGARVGLDWIERSGVPVPVFRLTGGAR